jgi:hypothetical protein
MQLQQSLKSKRCKEPLILSRLTPSTIVQTPKPHGDRRERGRYLELLLKALFHRLLSLLLLTHLLQVLIPNLLLQLLNALKRISRRHQMIVIDHLDERLYFASLGDTFLAHSRGDFARVTLDASDQGVAEGMHLCAVVVGLEDHGLAARIATSGDECDFARFQDYSLRLAAVEAREWEGSTHFGIFESVGGAK